MNTQSNTSPHDHAGSPDGGPAPTPETRPMYWSVRRELWENRFLYIAPLIVTAFVLFGSFVSIATMSHRMRSVAQQDPARLLKTLDMAPAPIMLATILIGMFYSLDALYGERRDRSILFWKSLPVSDLTTVLSKASIPLVVLPLLAFALSVVTQMILLMLSIPVLLGNGLNPATALSEFRFFQGPLIMLYGLTVHALWFAPVYGWLMLISAWARRATLLWAVMPLLGMAALEKITFRTSYFTHMLQYRLTGAMAEAFAFKAKGTGDGNFDRLDQLTPGEFLSAPGLWIGLVFAAAFLAAVVRLRRNREPI